MDLLIDTNIFMDVFLRRQPFEELSKKIFQMCVLKEHNGIIASDSFTNMFYILRKNYSQTDLRALLLNVAKNFKISSLTKQKLVNALLRVDFLDFEDCLQDECAIEFCADYIITRNPKDFENSQIKALTPEEFLSLKMLDKDESL